VNGFPVQAMYPRLNEKQAHGRNANFTRSHRWLLSFPWLSVLTSHLHKYRVIQKASHQVLSRNDLLKYWPIIKNSVIYTLSSKSGITTDHHDTLKYAAISPCETLEFKDW